MKFYLELNELRARNHANNHSVNLWNFFWYILEDHGLNNLALETFDRLISGIRMLAWITSHWLENVCTAGMIVWILITIWPIGRFVFHQGEPNFVFCSVFALVFEESFSLIICRLICKFCKFMTYYMLSMHLNWFYDIITSFLRFDNFQIGKALSWNIRSYE